MLERPADGDGPSSIRHDFPGVETRFKKSTNARTVGDSSRWLGKTIIDMHVPPCGGPNAHRHDFEEMFTLLEGEIEVHFRGKVTAIRQGETANIPANAPHFFKNASQGTVRLLCMCTPAGQEEYFARVGVRVDSRTAEGPPLDDRFVARATALAAEYRTEILPPWKSRATSAQ